MSPNTAAISRRSLLAGAAGLGGAALLAGCRPRGSIAGAPSSPKAGGTAVLAQSADITPISVLAQNLPNLVFQRNYQFDASREVRGFPDDPGAALRAFAEAFEKRATDTGVVHR